MKNSLPRRFPVLVCPLLALLLPAGMLRADLEEEIGEATDLGIEYLLKAIEAKQSDGPEDGARKREGKIALETYALLVSGVSVEHPIIRKNLETLAGFTLNHTYSVACYAFALDAAISQLQGDAMLANPSQKMVDPSVGSVFRPRLEAAVTALVRMRRKNGGWIYTGEGNGFDNSNTQFAVLGLGVAHKHRIPVPREVWEEVALHFLGGQKKEGPEVMERPEFYAEDDRGDAKRDRINLVDKDGGKKAEKGKKGDKKGGAEKEKGGSPTVAKKVEEKKAETGQEEEKYFARGWDYQHKGGETWNMTCGGTSSMIIAEQNLRGMVPPDFQAKIRKSIRDGYAWLTRNWSVGGGGEWSYYGIYSLEKVADLGEVKKFGNHDWFKEVSRFVLDQQRADGSWPGGGPMEIRWNTSFALLVLNRASSLLTQGRSVKPGGRVALTGLLQKRDKENTDDRNWVFIPEFDREFHVPTILRQIKLRPSVRLAKIMEQALKAYPEEQRGFLVWNLARTREETRNKSVKSLLDDRLMEITGVKYDTVEKYEKWYKRWVDVQKIGTEAKDPDGLLRICYPTTSKSLPLKKKVMWAVGRCRDQEIAPLLLDDLAHAEADIRQAAYETLSLLRLSRETMPLFDAKGEAAARDQQVAQIRNWYAKRKTEA